MAHRKLVAVFLCAFVGLVLADGSDQPTVFTRFEYKHSFKGPHLVDRKGRVPFWTSSGNTMASNDQVRLTPSIRSMKGSLWNNIEYESDRWSVEVWLRVTGRGSVGGDGMAIWFRDQPAEAGNVFGVSDAWVGMGLILDSYDNDGAQDNPMVALVMNDGTKEYDHNSDGRLHLSGQCKRDFRNRAHPVRLRIHYDNGQLRVEYDPGTAAEPLFEVCLIASDVRMPKKGYFGVSAATGGLADDHDVLRFLTTSISDKPFVTGNVPTLKEEEANKAQDMYNKFSDDLEKQKEEYAKEHPQAAVEDPVVAHQTPVERSMFQILEGMQELRELTRNLHVAVTSTTGVAGQPQQQQQQQVPSAGAFDAMISQSLARMSAEVQQILRRNQDETNNILRLHAESVRRLENGAGTGSNSNTAAQLASISENLHNQQRNMETVTQRLTAMQNDLSNAASGGSAGSGDCLSYTTVVIVVVVEAMFCLALHMYQRRAAAAAEKKFF